LLIWDEDVSLEVQPKQNGAVVFPSFSFHEVKETTVSGEKWEDARFSVNDWIGFQ
jgi:Rps23 Pro-64 3,4-dihydroxylase Tpa1-like proline 4-hydroxylase